MKNAATDLMCVLWPVASLVAVLALMLLLAVVADSRAIDATVTDIFIKIVAVVALYIFVGNSGIIAFSHVGFMAIGAYATSWMTCCPSLKKLTMYGLPEFLLQNTFPTIPALLLAGLLAAVVAFLVALIVMRLSGIAASIATFATLFIIYYVYANWGSVTLGVRAVVGLPVYVTPLVGMICGAITIIVAYTYQVSRFGLALRAGREDEVAARAAGIRIYWQRVGAFTLSGFFSGVAGVLLAHYLGTIQIDTFFLDMTFLMIAMLVIGGMYSLSGAVIGVIVVTVSFDLLSLAERGINIGNVTLALPTGLAEIILAATMLGILILRPVGVMGKGEICWPFFRRQRISVVDARQ